MATWLRLFCFFVLSTFVLGCGPKSEPRTEDKTDFAVKVGDHSPVLIDFANSLKTHHEAHFTDIKIGVGVVLLLVLAIVLFHLQKVCRRCDTRRIERRATSMMVRRYDKRGTALRDRPSSEVPNDQP